MKSVLQDWVMNLPLRQQGVLILALRGPDGARKESFAKPILRALRAVTMNSGRHGRPMRRGERMDGDSFMRMDELEHHWGKLVDDFLGSVDEFNLHFYQHLMHACAVVGFNHLDEAIQSRFHGLYEEMVHKLHCKPESYNEFTYRLRDGRRLEEDE